MTPEDVTDKLSGALTELQRERLTNALENIDKAILLMEAEIVGLGISLPPIGLPPISNPPRERRFARKCRLSKRRAAAR